MFEQIYDNMELDHTLIFEFTIEPMKYYKDVTYYCQSKNNEHIGINVKG
jgi:hypothetical protein